MTVTYNEWVSDDYDVKIARIKELPQVVDEQGYVYRAYGISERVLDCFGGLTNELFESLIDAEELALMEFDWLLEEYGMENGIEQYFPSGIMGVIIDDGAELRIEFMMNVLCISPGVYKRFTALVHPEERKHYILERSTQNGVEETGA